MGGCVTKSITGKINLLPKFSRSQTFFLAVLVSGSERSSPARTTPPSDAVLSYLQPLSAMIQAPPGCQKPGLFCTKHGNVTGEDPRGHKPSPVPPACPPSASLPPAPAAGAHGQHRVHGWRQKWGNKSRGVAVDSFLCYGVLPLR